MTVAAAAAVYGARCHGVGGLSESDSVTTVGYELTRLLQRIASSLSSETSPPSGDLK